MFANKEILTAESGAVLTRKSSEIAPNEQRDLCRSVSRYTCDCEMPLVFRKWSDAMGVLVDVKLCCLAKKVQELTGMELYTVREFDPVWEWDCDHIEEIVDDNDKTIVTEVIRGAPPEWMQKRMKKRGIKIKNMP